MSEQPLFGDMLVRLGLVTTHQVQEALALQTLSGQRVGEALISLGYVTREQLQRALSEALGLGQAQSVRRPPLGELLVGLKHITPEQRDQALARQKHDGRKLGEILVELGSCSYRQVYEGLALQQRMSESAPAEPAPQKREKPRVLVVDDSPLAVALVKEGLTELGYEVHDFTDPYQALEQVFRLKPNIVLSDLEMPGMTGAELCRRLKDGPTRSIPVLILTANDTDKERVEGLRSGADDYVAKSASMAELAARIDGIVRRTGETERVRKLFARYTSDAVVEEIMKQGGEVVLTGEKREVTLLFADIRDFTALAESLPPETVVDILNGVLGKLSEAVLLCGGTLDKYLGDGLMAVFGAPVCRPDDSLRALQAAKMMMEAMDVSNQQARTDGQPELRLGIGINSGVVVVGNLGSEKRTEYTCIGDAVNVASRLCAAAGPGEVYVGARTCELVGASATFERLPPIRLKGKAQAVPLFRLALGTAAPDAGRKIAS